MHRCRSDILELIPADQAQLVEWLAVPHQSAYAIRKLKQLGSRAVPSLMAYSIQNIWSESVFA